MPRNTYSGCKDNEPKMITTGASGHWFVGLDCNILRVSLRWRTSGRVRINEGSHRTSQDCNKATIRVSTCL